MHGGLQLLGAFRSVGCGGVISADSELISLFAYLKMSVVPRFVPAAHKKSHHCCTEPAEANQTHSRTPRLSTPTVLGSFRLRCVMRNHVLVHGVRPCDLLALYLLYLNSSRSRRCTHCSCVVFCQPVGSHQSDKGGRIVSPPYHSSTVHTPERELPNFPPTRGRPAWGQ